jgi:hypothetical protein
MNTTALSYDYSSRSSLPRRDFVVDWEVTVDGGVEWYPRSYSVVAPDLFTAEQVSRRIVRRTAESAGPDGMFRLEQVREVERDWEGRVSVRLNYRRERGYFLRG